MEIKIMQGDLIEGLRFIKAFVSKNKDATAIEKTLLLEVISTAPAILRIRCNDKSVWGVVDVPLSYADELGEFPLLDSDKFIGYLMTKKPKDEIKIKLKENAITITSKKDRSRPKIVIMLGKYSYEPNIEEDNTYYLNCENFKKGVAKSAELIPTSADKITDICVAVTISKNVMMFEARQLVSNIMMSYFLTNTLQTAEKGIRIIVDCHKLKNILNAFTGDEDIELSISENFFMFKQGNKRAFIKKIFGKITPFNHMFPKTVNDDGIISFSCNKEDMMINTTRVDKLMNDKIKTRYCDIVFKTTDGKMISDGGQSNVEEYIDFVGPDNVESIKRFSILSLFKIISISDSDTIVFLIPNKSNHIFLFSQKDKGSIIKLIVPLLSI